ncbi:MAG: hypothetical protein EBS60_03685 [Verrucomicrobia bacterium]|nr:hypothetical protein [Verrucomicrobiota bacterium]
MPFRQEDRQAIYNINPRNPNMKNMLQILLATLIALPAMNGRAESLDKLVPDCAEILGRMKREDIINMDLVKEAKGIVTSSTWIW